MISDPGSPILRKHPGATECDDIHYTVPVDTDWPKAYRDRINLRVGQHKNGNILHKQRSEYSKIVPVNVSRDSEFIRPEEIVHHVSNLFASRNGSRLPARLSS